MQEKTDIFKKVLTTKRRFTTLAEILQYGTTKVLREVLKKAKQERRSIDNNADMVKYINEILQNTSRFGNSDMIKNLCDSRYEDCSVFNQPMYEVLLDNPEADKVLNQLSDWDTTVKQYSKLLSLVELVTKTNSRTKENLVLTNSLKEDVTKMLLHYIVHNLTTATQFRNRVWCLFNFMKDEESHFKVDVGRNPKSIIMYNEWTDLQVDFMNILDRIITEEFIVKMSKMAAIRVDNMDKLFTIAFKGSKYLDVTLTSAFKALNIYSEKYSLNPRIYKFMSAVRREYPDVYSSLMNIPEHDYAMGEVTQDMDLHVYVTNTLKEDVPYETKRIVRLVAFMMTCEKEFFIHTLKKAILIGALSCKMNDPLLIAKFNGSLFMLKETLGTKHGLTAKKGSPIPGHASFLLGASNLDHIVRSLELRHLFWENK